MVKHDSEGYVRLGNSILMQWGKRKGGSQVFDFPIPFPKAPFFLSVMMIASPTGSVVIDKYITPDTMTASGTRIGLKWISSSEHGSDISEEWLWIAFGEA